MEKNARRDRAVSKIGLAPIFPYTFYHLTHYWSAAADIPVVNDIPVHYADGQSRLSSVL